MWTIIVIFAVLAVAIIGYVGVQQARHPVTPKRRPDFPGEYDGWHW